VSIAHLLTMPCEIKSELIIFSTRPVFGGPGLVVVHRFNCIYIS